MKCQINTRRKNRTILCNKRKIEEEQKSFGKKNIEKVNKSRKRR